MKRKDIAINQHYVPQFLLKNFTQGKKPQVWVFDKKTGNKFKSNVRNVASEKNFYDFTFKGVEGTIEPALSEIESSASKILKKIKSENNISFLDDSSKAHLSNFFALQFVRTKQHRLMCQNLGVKMAESMRQKGWSPEDMGYKEETEEDIKTRNIRAICRSGEFAPHFYDKSWLLCKTSKKLPLYISDNPIALQNSKDYGFYGNIGLGVKGIEIYFPLSKTLTLAMYCPSLEEEFRVGFKKYQSLSRISPMLVAQHIKDPLYFEQTKEGFDTGSAITFKDTNVINQNSLQVKHASRFVFSSSDDFSLAQEMISSHPELREGPQIEVN